MKNFHNIALVIILLIYVLTVSALLSRGHNWGDDFASYIMQAKSIVAGTEKIFYEQNSFTIHNSSSAIGPVAYPWGYPIFLSFFYAIFGLNPLALKIPNILFFVLFLIVFFRLLNKRLPPWECILLVSILAFNPNLLSFQNSILSDIPFLFFSTLSVLLIDWFVCENKNIPSSPVNNLTLGISIFLATFVRTTGILLLVTLLGCQIIVICQQWKKIFERPKILFIFLIPYIVFGSLWFISGLILPSGESSYLFSYSSYSFVGILKGNLYYYYHLMESFLTGMPSVEVLYGFFLVFLLIGIISRIEKDYAFIIYSVLTIGLLFVWPGGWQGLRYIFPIIPFFVYFSFQGMKIGFSSLKEYYRRAGLAIIYLFWIAMLIVFAANSGKLIQANLAAERQEIGPFDTYSTDMFNFIWTDTPSNSVIVFFKPRAMHLMTDRNSIRINTCNELTRGDYVVLSKNELGNRNQVDKIDSCGLSTTQVFKNDNFVVYKLNK